MKYEARIVWKTDEQAWWSLDEQEFGDFLDFAEDVLNGPRGDWKSIQIKVLRDAD